MPNVFSGIHVTGNASILIYIDDVYATGLSMNPEVQNPTWNDFLPRKIRRIAQLL